jgi:hypothetical protein
MTRRARIALGATSAAALALVLAAVVSLRAPRLLAVESPALGDSVGIEGVEVLVRFDGAGRVEPSTFRALLNGADITAQLEVAENGVHGRLHGLLDGPNVLRLQAFGRGLFGHRVLVEESVEREILYRPPLDLDRG